MVIKIAWSKLQTWTWHHKVCIIGEPENLGVFVEGSLLWLAYNISKRWPKRHLVKFSVILPPHLWTFLNFTVSKFSDGGRFNFVASWCSSISHFETRNLLKSPMLFKYTQKIPRIPMELVGRSRYTLYNTFWHSWHTLPPFSCRV